MFRQGKQAVKKSAQQNVVVIYADDLGFGDLGCYGSRKIDTPNLDRLCAEGLKFTNAYSTSAVCTPARFSILTGRYPFRNDQAHILPGDAGCIIKRELDTVPKLFQRAGYHTGIVGKWHLGLGDGSKPIDWNQEINLTPIDLGFEESFIFPATADRVPCVFLEGRIVNGIGRIGYMRGGSKAVWKDEELAETFLNRAKQFISDSCKAEKPFFLYYALHQPHVPRVPSARFEGATGLGPRGDVIAELDWCVGEVMAALEKEGILDNTMIIFSSDNGPVLDDGYLDRAYELNGTHRAAGPLRGGKYSKFDGGTRIPFIVYSSALKHRGVSEALISQVDLYASFAHMLGIETREDSAVDSQDRYAALIGEDPAGRSELMTEDLSCGKMLRCGRWVYLSPSEGAPYMPFTRIETGLSKDPQLYNMDYDIGQQNNIAWDYADQVEKMEKRLQEILTSESTR